MFMNNRQFAGLATVIILLFTSMATYAERLIPFQGRLTDGNSVAIQGVERVTFVIYDEPTGGTALWTEVHDNVSIIGGQVNVLLGSRTKLDDPDGNPVTTDRVDFTNPRYLGITIGVATNQEMLPRHQLVPSFHARTADHASNATLADRATIATDSEKLGGNLPSYYAVATGTGNTLTQLTQRLDALDILVDNTRTNTIPTGTILPHAGPIDSDRPADFYYCDGSMKKILIDTTPVAENQALFDVIGYRYGKTVIGNETYFHVPDYRGMFLRGWANGSANDPDRANRTGLDIDGFDVTGDFVGTTQTDELTSHQHRFNFAALLGYSAGGGNPNTYPSNWSGTGAIFNSEPIGGNETRPINTSVRYIIKR